MKKSLKLTTLSSAIALTLGLTASFSTLASSVQFEGEAACFSSSYSDMAENTVNNGDFVEVSGFFDDHGNLVVSDVEAKKPSDKEIELKGYVTYFMGDFITLNGVTINISQAKFKDFSNGLFEGAYVEVKGYFKDDKLVATKVESEAFEYGDKDEFEIKGYVSDFEEGYFKVNGMMVDATSYFGVSSPMNTQMPDNAYVEVEGRFVDGVLVIDQCKVRKEEVKLSAMVTKVDAESKAFEVTLVEGQAPVMVYTGMETKFENDYGYDYGVRVGDFVEVEGYLNGKSSIFAKEVEASKKYEVEVEGTLDAIKDDKITVLGVDFFIDGYTRFKGEDGYVTQMQFEYDVKSGYSIVEVKDKNRDGVADKIELED
jgi:hypothetical protein